MARLVAALFTVLGVALLSTPSALSQGALPDNSNLTAWQTMAWTNANRFFDALSEGRPGAAIPTLSPDVSFNLHMNPAFVQLGEEWWGQSGYLGFSAYGQGLALSKILLDSSHGIVKPVTVDTQNLYVTGSRSVEFFESGRSLMNTSVGAIVAVTPEGLLQKMDVYYDSSAWAQASCPSGILKCSGNAVDSDAHRKQATMMDSSGRLMLRTPPRLPSYDGLLQAQLDATAPTPSDQMNLKQLSSYFNAIFAGDLSVATNYLDSSVTTIWHGSPNIVPIAGTFHGKDGWIKWLSGAVGSVNNFTIVDFSIPSCIGGASSNVEAMCVAKWKEYNYTKLPVGTKPVDGLVNLVFYTFNPSHLITRIEIFTDSVSYAIRFCGGLLRCTA